MDFRFNIRTKVLLGAKTHAGVFYDKMGQLFFAGFDVSTRGLILLVSALFLVLVLASL